MSTRRFLLGTMTVAVAAVLAAAGVTSPTQPTTASTDRPVLVSHVAPSAPATGLQPLQEFRTSGDAGWFYTLNPTEAANAVSKFKFTKSATIGRLHANPVPGGVAIHRLKVKAGGPSYMLSISPAEIKDPRFVDEGVVGYADGTQKPGQVRLLRFSNNGKWRVLSDTPANINNMKAAGYKVDGPLGWFLP